VKAVKGLVDTQAVDDAKFDALPLRRVVFGHEDWRVSAAAPHTRTSAKRILAPQ